MYECDLQYCRRSVDSGGLKGFSLFCSDVGVEPKYSDVRSEMLCFEASVGVFSSVLLERSEGVGVGD